MTATVGTETTATIRNRHNRDNWKQNGIRFAVTKNSEQCQKMLCKRIGPVSVYYAQRSCTIAKRSLTQSIAATFHNINNVILIYMRIEMTEIRIAEK
jgi:hypothetical protein